MDEIIQGSANEVAASEAEGRDEYEAPVIEEHGTLNQMTQGGSGGGYLDANFSAGTPFSDLTFSG